MKIAGIILLLMALVGCSNADVAAIGAGLRGMGAGIQGGATLPPPPNQNRIVLLKTQISQGQSVLCVYDNLGSPYVLTMPVGTICQPGVPAPL